MGRNHTVVLTENGSVLTFGANVGGQLGTGNAKPQQGLVHVKKLEQAVIEAVGATGKITACYLPYIYMIIFSLVLRYQFFDLHTK